MKIPIKHIVIFNSYVKLQVWVIQFMGVTGRKTSFQELD